MSEFAISASQMFPADTLVSAYPGEAFTANVDYSALAPAAAVSSATMNSNGIALFAGLQANCRYMAGARVAGAMRYIQFTTHAMTESVVGPEGKEGARGVAGPTGATGSGGATGAVGATGSSGERGLTGAAGATGERGEKGLTGSAGAAGATGSQGASGATGATGERGLQGEPGTPSSLSAPITGISLTSGTAMQPNSSRPCLVNVLATLSGILGTGAVTLTTAPTKEGTYVTVGKMPLLIATGISLGEQNDLVAVPAGYWLKATVSGVAVGNVALTAVRWDD